MPSRTAAAAGAARFVIRPYIADEVEDILGAVGYRPAPQRYRLKAPEHPPPEIDSQLVHNSITVTLCATAFHQDYIVKKASTSMRAESANAGVLQARGAQYLAEHNVGHLYKARRKR